MVNGSVEGKGEREREKDGVRGRQDGKEETAERRAGKIEGLGGRMAVRIYGRFITLPALPRLREEGRISR